MRGRRARLEPAAGRRRLRRPRAAAGRRSSRPSRSTPPLVRCGGGASLAAIVRQTRDAGLSGIEFGCAIPGTVGGAVRMNAGAYGREMRDVAGRGGGRLGRRHAARRPGRARAALPRLERRPRRGRRRAPSLRPDAGRSGRRDPGHHPRACRTGARRRSRARRARSARSSRTRRATARSGQLLEALRAQGLRDRRRPHLAAARELHRERRRAPPRPTSSR